MTKYQSIKTVDAQPMDRIEAENAGLVRDETGVNEPGYKVVYSDGYTSWSPAAVFEKGYEVLNVAPSNHLASYGDPHGYKTVLVQTEGNITTEIKALDTIGGSIIVTNLYSVADDSEPCLVGTSTTFAPSVGLIEVQDDKTGEVTARYLRHYELIQRINEEQREAAANAVLEQDDES